MHTHTFVGKELNSHRMEDRTYRVLHTMCPLSYAPAPSTAQTIATVKCESITFRKFIILWPAKGIFSFIFLFFPFFFFSLLFIVANKYVLYARVRVCV